MQAAQRAHLAVRTEQLDPVAQEWLARECEVLVAKAGSPEFLARASDINALVIRTYTTVDDALLESLPALKVVARAGVGVDNVDLEACLRRGVAVVYTPDANTQAVVEYVFCLMCDAIRPRIELQGLVSKNEWDSIRSTVCGERQLNELTLGILGLGRIGSRLARAAGALGMRVIYNDLKTIHPDLRHGSEEVSLDELLTQADVLSVHIDGRPANHDFLNATSFDRLKDNAILINTSRGFVINEADLAAWLSQHPRAQAILDVHAKEPFQADSPLLRIENATLMPHLASRTHTAMANMSWVVKDVLRVLKGEAPKHDAIADLLPKT